MTITFKDGSRKVAREGANAYARAIEDRALANFASVFDTYASGEARAQADVARLNDEIDGYQRQLGAAGDPTTRTQIQSLLFAATTQLSIAQQTLTEQQLNRAKAEANEKPYIVSLSESPSSSSSAPNRLRTVVLAAVIGLLVGIIVTFVWRGSPAGRAGRE
jgi:uncharacterized protein involved in exopolysaccharide biosynthesis